MHHQSNPWRGAAAGALGGIVGSWMMVRFNHLLPRSDHDDGHSTRSGRDSHPHRRDDASPNDTDATISDEPASSQLASLVAEPLLGRPLTEPEKERTGPFFHYAFGAVAGAVYGAVAEVAPRTTAAAGLPFGAAVWATADELALPAFGLARKPTEYPLSRHASALGSHLVYGLTVEGVRRLLRGHGNGDTHLFR